jgi:hypothetical protein
MEATLTAVVAAVGQWDFNDGRSVKYVDLVDGSGGGTFRATVAEGETPPAFGAVGTARIEMTAEAAGRSVKIKCRLLGFEAQKARAAA